MKIARVTGSVTATFKVDELAGLALLLVNIEDGAGKVLEPGLVVADCLGAGPGDLVLVVSGSSARLPAGVAGLAIDATSVAIIDEISIDSGGKRRTKPEERK